jgi:hypothetical protein
MTLEKPALQKLSKWKHPGDQRRTLVVADADGNWSLTVAADRCDELGCLVWELTFQRGAGFEWSRWIPCASRPSCAARTR